MARTPKLWVEAFESSAGFPEHAYKTRPSLLAHPKDRCFLLQNCGNPMQEETMRQTMILTGEINLKTVTDPKVPFGRVTTELGEADLVFANLECLLADPPAEYATNQTAFHTTSEGFYAGPVAGEALKLAGFAGVGC